LFEFELTALIFLAVEDRRKVAEPHSAIISVWDVSAPSGLSRYEMIVKLTVSVLARSPRG
jgi:hypothetical protein